MLSTIPGTVLSSTKEKNIIKINQYQNLVIPKGSTVISKTIIILSINKNFKINKNINKSSGYSSRLEKTNTQKNNNYIKDNNNNALISAKKNKSKNIVKKINNEEKYIPKDKENFLY